MAIPVINAIINFSTGAGFASPMILDAGILGVNALADSTAVTVDVSDVVDSIKTIRGRSANADNFQTGSMSLRIIDQNGYFNPMNPASPYYNLLTPMRKVQITATYGTKTYPIFAGYITSYSTTTPRDVAANYARACCAGADAERHLGPTAADRCGVAFAAKEEPRGQ